MRLVISLGKRGDLAVKSAPEIPFVAHAAGRELHPRHHPERAPTSQAGVPAWDITLNQ
jgi:hypothetical protein